MRRSGSIPTSLPSMNSPRHPARSASAAQLHSIPSPAPTSTKNRPGAPVRRTISARTPSSPFWENTRSSNSVRSARSPFPGMSPPRRRAYSETASSCSREVPGELAAACAACITRRSRCLRSLRSTGPTGYGSARTRTLRAHDHGSRSHVRDAARPRHDHGVRQPRLDRAADARRLPRGLPLRARPARGRGSGDGRRLRAGERPARARQPPHRAGRRQRDGRDLQRAVQQVAAPGHRGPAGALADDAAGAADQPRRGADAASARQVELRAAARRGRPARARARDPSRRAAAEGPGLRLDPDGRLARGGRRRCGPPPDDAHGRWPRGRRPRAGAGARAAARGGGEPRVRGRPGHRRERRLGRRRRAGREGAAAGVGGARHRRRAASASPRATRTSRASCRPRSARSRRRSPATT